MSNEKTKMASYVEEQIIKLTFRAKNFTQDEMDFVDDYCKARYDNNRKLMILDLLRYKEENTALLLLDDKIDRMYDELSNKINVLNNNEPKDIKEVKKGWKGFGDKE